MPYIKRLIISGLYSFERKTQITFAPGGTLIVGPNNSGKTNIGKAMDFVGLILKKTSKSNQPLLPQGRISIPVQEIVNDLHHTKEWEDVFFNQKVSKKINIEVGFAFNKDFAIKLAGPNVGRNKNQTHLGHIIDTCKTEEVELSISFSIQSANNNNACIVSLQHLLVLPTNKDIERPAERDPYVFFDKESDTFLFHERDDSTGNPIFIFKKISPDGLSRNPQILGTLNNVISDFSQRIMSKKTLHFISHSRSLGKTSYGHNPSSTAIIEDQTLDPLMNLRDGRGPQRKKFSWIKHSILKLLFPGKDTNDFEFLFPKKNDGLYELEIDQGDRILPLSSYGSGVEQILFTLTKISTYKEGSIVFIEEPETNLHPGLQKALLNFLNEMDYQFVFTSHSNVLINDFLASEYSNIVRISKLEDASITQNAISLLDLKQSLHDLGVNGAQILQANGIIWVEGPSDVNYLRKWIDLYFNLQKDPPPIEGKDYLIVSYGGSILSHYSFKDDLFSDKEKITELINLVKINHNTIVVMDRDNENTRFKKWNHKQKIQEDLSRMGDNCMTWITYGYEIENYLPKNLISQELGEGELKEAYKVNSKLAFSSFLKNKDKNKYCKNKAVWSKKIVKNFTEEDLVNNPELLRKIEEICLMLIKWTT